MIVDTLSQIGDSNIHVLDGARRIWMGHEVLLIQEWTTRE